MAGDDSLDRDTLSSMTVVELREICKEKSLLVSGRKSELVDRILGDLGVEPEISPPEAADALIMDEGPDEASELDSPEVASERTEHAEAVERLISRLGGEDPPEEAADEGPRWEGEVVEAELVEAELVESEPEAASKAAETATPVDAPEEDEASLVITIPTISSLGERWQTVASVAIVVLLVGVLATQVLQQNAGFAARPLHYGDQMDFFVRESTISIEGDEMLAVIRDSADGILDDACGQLTTVMTGTGQVAISHGSEDGASPTSDNLGRDGFLAVEKRLSMDLDIDFEGRTWRDSGDCGNVGWTLSDNTLILDSTSWVELEDRNPKRSDSTMAFTDVDSRTTNLRAVTYGFDGFGGLGTILPTLAFPMTPIELSAFFDDEVLEAGASSSDISNWNSEWTWEVKPEISHETHGLVYPIEMQHEDIGQCYGHAYLSILVKRDSPWPVEQVADIVFDKDLRTNDCNFLVSSLSEELLPEGRLAVSMTISKNTGSSGSVEVDWGRDYLKPKAGEDQPSSSTERNWVDAMWDESEIRPFDLEEAIACLKANHSTSDAAVAILGGGYFWQAQWSQPTGTPEWNLSWVDEDDRSGWLVLRSADSSGCDVVGQGSNDDGDVTWNRDAIPSTQTMALLEGRILDPARYPDLQDEIATGTGGVWHPNAAVGYRLSVSEEIQLFSLLPGDLGDGKVTMTAGRDWSDGGRAHSTDLAMDAETGEMVTWYHVDRPAE
ncbi:MAG: SAP domain-containing protein [Candidatus Thermoplasmatota archaeon]|nr:SAP domain-containing protein [Candidatus Thermoplasmatota archaeon]